MTTTARLGAISIDCADPAALAQFYRQVLDLEVLFESEQFVALKGAAVLLTFQRVADHQPPQWPEGGVPKQLHLELAASDLDAEEPASSGWGLPRPRSSRTRAVGGCWWTRQGTRSASPT